MVRESEIMQASVKPSSRADGKGAFAALTPAIWDVILLSVVWIGSVVLVNPAGNFPLNDDWAYGKAVRGLVEQGSFRPCPWGGMTLISQAVWGRSSAFPPDSPSRRCGFPRFAWR